MLFIILAKIRVEIKICRDFLGLSAVVHLAALVAASTGFGIFYTPICFALWYKKHFPFVSATCPEHFVGSLWALVFQFGFYSSVDNAIFLSLISLKE